MRHQLGGLFRQSVFGRLAGYEDVNDAERLARDPAMRASPSGSPGATTAETLPNNTSRRGRTRSAGHGCPAMPSGTTPCGSSCTPSLTIFANFLRTLALPAEVEHWSLTTLREKLVKIGARIVRHGRYVVFQLGEAAVPRALFAEILRRIDQLRPLLT